MWFLIPMAIGAGMQIGSQFAKNPGLKRGLSMGGSALMMGGGAAGAMGAGAGAAAGGASGGAGGMIPQIAGAGMQGAAQGAQQGQQQQPQIAIRQPANMIAPPTGTQDDDTVAERFNDIYQRGQEEERLRQRNPIRTYNLYD